MQPEERSMTVRERGKGYMVDFQLAGIRYRPPVFGTLETAIKWEVEARAAIRFGKALPSIPPVADSLQKERAPAQLGPAHGADKMRTSSSSLI
jgi:hypothetical protein